jgi:hypothetical protein
MKRIIVGFKFTTHKEDHVRRALRLIRLVRLIVKVLL